MLADTKVGRKIARSINLAEPTDHTSDYDPVIMMLKMSVDDTILLDAAEFDSFVRDLWAWSNHTTTLRELAAACWVYRRPKRDGYDEDETE